MKISNLRRHERVSILRKRKNITLAAASKHLGLNIRYLSEYESGKRDLPIQTELAYMELIYDKCLDAAKTAGDNLIHFATKDI